MISPFTALISMAVAWMGLTFAKGRALAAAQTQEEMQAELARASAYYGRDRR